MDNVSAVIVTFHPDDGIISRIKKIAEQVSKIYIIDNSNNGEYECLFDDLDSEYRSKLDVTILGENRGVSTALNIGLKKSYTDGFYLAVTFDQDSTICDGFISTLCKTFNENDDGKLALVGCNFVDSSDFTNKLKFVRFSRFGYEKIHADHDVNVDLLITSGCLTNIHILAALGWFKDELFIDYVDTEYCLRCAIHGYKCMVSSDAHMIHQLGDQKIKKIKNITIRPSNHNENRRYYMARNSIYVYRMYGVKYPGWLLFDITDTIKNLIKICLFESQKSMKLKMYVRGWLDGFLNRYGPYDGFKD
ncbi:glycosyltransferase family 2 protein [Pectobacterium aroidearum]|uniref:glycosyltransferase family 2 protein n=1 Tax=Pectobacterium aroidearum TaxID=1201031 RepID=UPI0015DE2BBE|nr:glycosyltransferase family 2 protein [Pectobacterium aroidearum]MBA0205334.1 glycosyltransferase family 2 protein [Pectobacterium aroidearum]